MNASSRWAINDSTLASETAIFAGVGSIVRRDGVVGIARIKRGELHRRLQLKNP